MLAFLHTSPVHVATFDDLLRRRENRIPVRHYVEEGILHRAKVAGAVTPEMRVEVERAVLTAFEDGATVLLCTCSTIGPFVEEMKEAVPGALLRVDRPMARLAIAAADRIAVVASLRSTLAPTRALILDEAEKARKTVALTDVVCKSAWGQFEEGDREGYLLEVGEAVRSVAERVGAVVLAQASMMGAEAYAPVSIPVYSSPETGLDEALRQYQERSE
jgi:hypothetical protein